LNSRP
jgi:hypothetical protein